ncbi:MAG: lactam utilization protein LamB [Chloroflexi bacterium]|nr:lactam utilization protein LamB [Chloroflexota bacterium]|tara:strand:+ start:20680 stop:21444 length:765 start_codon:yes stop_codon:yes gene_type:complete
MNGVIDLNADIGESYGLMKSGKDEFISPHVTSVNIATGFHSGDPDSISKTVDLALQNNNSIGAHPSFPDLQGFGRRFMEMSKASINNIMTYQIGALSAFVKDKISHVKPHGALYNAAAKDIKIVEPIFDSILNFDPEIIHVVLANSVWEDFVKSKKVKFSREGFADRAYTDDGQLVSRNIPGSVLKNHDEILERVISMALKGKVKTIKGKEINLQIDTICLHGDNEESVELAKAIKEELIRMGCEVTKMTDFID